jgi:hypothetical protein
MHDGRAVDLRAAIVDMIDATRPDRILDVDDLLALEAFVRTR